MEFDIAAKPLSPLIMEFSIIIFFEGFPNCNRLKTHIMQSIIDRYIYTFPYC